MSGKQVRIYNLARDVPDQRDYMTYFKISSRSSTSSAEECAFSRTCSNRPKMKRTKKVDNVCNENKRIPQQVAVKV